MATYPMKSVEFSDDQELGLDRKVFLRNKSRAERVPPLPAQSKQEYLDSLVAGWPEQFFTEVRNDLKDRFTLAIKDAPAADIAAVASTLGVELNPYEALAPSPVVLATPAVASLFTKAKNFLFG